ncbi:hypothetical protein CPB83DRAFT_546521 [Crepidotus variabilis]|uniref:Uncharacterized protein n=1 Tax=Crepidotus variabilis TaxID=179855 RepID=A0A9P6JMC6_9AGAR|nr:hypothetical protein CPB83DRAFT_546521 [Crepidotus variabilis]
MVIIRDTASTTHFRPLKWISQWFGRQRTKGRKQKDSAPNSRSRTGSTVVDSLDSRSTPESFSKSNMSALSTGEIIQVKKEQQDGQSSFSTSGFVIDTVVPYTPGGLSAADPSNRQPSCAKACDNTRDAYSRSKIGFTPENVVAGGAYTSLLATDSPISRRGNLSTAIGPPKKSVLSVQSTTESTLPSSSVGPEARLVPPSDAHLKSISCHSFEHSVAVSAAREAAHAIKLAYSNDEAALDSQLLYTSETLGHVENKGTRISSRRKCSAAPLSCLQPLAPVQSHSIKVSSNLPPHDNVAKQGAYSKVIYTLIPCSHETDFW